MPLQTQRIENRRYPHWAVSLSDKTARQPQGLPASHRLLTLTNVLQTSLEVDELIRLFAGETQSEIGFDGVLYQEYSYGLDIAVGEQTPHTLSYTLSLREEQMGEIRFFRSLPFNKAEAELLESYLCTLIYPLRNGLKYMRAVQTSYIDALTGVKNRAAMNNALHREIELAHRQNSDLSIVVVDVDHFKRINDQFGHSAGDEVLCQIARALEECVRCSDMVFRYGGEEFVALLSYTDLEGAAKLAERVREKVAKLEIPVIDGQQISASLGVTTLLPSDDGASLFNRSDKALYRAKQSGRNRVVVDRTQARIV